MVFGEVKRANHQLVIFYVYIWLWTFPRWFLETHWERPSVLRAAFLWLRRFEWDPPILIDLPNCAAVDTELQVGDTLIQVWLGGQMKDRRVLIIEMRKLLKWPIETLCYQKSVSTLFATDNAGPVSRAKEPTMLFHMKIRKSDMIARLPDNMTHFCSAFVSDLLFPPRPLQQVNDVDVTRLKQGMAW